MSHGTSFEYETASLRDEHEVAYDVRMGDLDRTAFLDLLTENRNDTSVGAEDVTEACGDELSGLLMAIEALAVDLADAL